MAMRRITKSGMIDRVSAIGEPGDICCSARLDGANLSRDKSGAAQPTRQDDTYGRSFPENGVKYPKGPVSREPD